MACDKPTGDCTNVSPCGGGCGCSDPAPQPVLPKCQDVALVPGSYANATIVVNTAGCISQVLAGEPEQYAPDDCCAGGSGGSGTPGPRGLKGDPGPAATITVDPVVDTGTEWSVVNNGTPSAAVFKFTAPASTGGGGGDVSGITGALNGFSFQNGLVKQAPSDLVTRATATMDGTKSDLVLFIAVPSLTSPGLVEFTLNVDLLYADLKAYIDDLHETQRLLIEDLQADNAAQANAITALQSAVAALQDEVESLQLSAGQFGTNGERLLWNASSSAISVEIITVTGTLVNTVNVPASAIVWATGQFGSTLPDGDYFARVNGTVIGMLVGQPA